MGCPPVRRPKLLIRESRWVSYGSPFVSSGSIQVDVLREGPVGPSGDPRC